MTANTIQQTTEVGYYVALTARTCLTLVSLLPSCSRLHASLPINLPSWDTPRRTIDDILSTVGMLFPCACCFHVEQDDTFCGLFVPPTARLDLHGQIDLMDHQR